MSVFSFFFLHFILLVFTLPVRLANAITLGNETDRHALLAFKSQITLDPQRVFSSWNDSLHFCNWEGVVCGHRHQRVRVLNLTSRGLEGSISPHTGNLSFLRTLVLQNNSFHGGIPQELGNLFRLENLYLSNNSFVGEIPVNISRCSKLITLTASRNNLVGNIPIELGSLSKLLVLALAKNKLTGGIPTSLGNLTSLVTLSLAENNLGGSVPHTLNQLKYLKNLALSSCDLSGAFPLSLFNLSTFEIISITDNRLSGNIPSEIGFMLPNIKLFFIGKNRFSGIIPTTLFKASSLQMIDLSYNQFRGKVPDNIGNLKGLTVIYMRGNNLGYGKSGDLYFFPSLTNCTQLQVFDISSNQFGGRLPDSIGNFSSQLRLLYLYRNLMTGNIPVGIMNLQKLNLLDMSRNFFTGQIPNYIGNFQVLGKLDLHRNQLSGQIPSSIKNMSQLFYLDFSHNFLEGSIAPSLDNQILQTLDLSYNNLSGTIPSENVGLSSRLITLNLAHNLLRGSVPSEVGGLENLEYLDVSENKMSGEIPNTLGSSSILQYLFLQGNFFHGPLPTTLGALKGLQILDVSRNNISGEIPNALGKLSVLQSLNLSFNEIEGEVPIEGIFRNQSAFSIYGNHKLCGGISKLGLPRCRNQKFEKQGMHLAFKLILGIFIPLSVIMLFLVIYWKKKSNTIPPNEPSWGDLRRVAYHDLHTATNGFSSSMLIGMGSYGSVYRGILQQGIPIAVKVFNLVEHGASKSFLSECEALRAVRHRNLLKILTVCSSVDLKGDDFKALIFEFMPNGSLESWLHPDFEGQQLTRCLNLYQRLNIAIDVAAALNYLHDECERPIVHCDLKPSNVLLDEDMTAHVGDFGVAKFLPKSTRDWNKIESTSTTIQGTIGYIPPEYGMGAEASTRGDAYSYGILLLEMFTGKKPTDHMFTSGLSLHDLCKMALSERLMDIIDKAVLPKDSHEDGMTFINQTKRCLSSIIKIGVACSVEQVSERMDIKDVLKELYSIKDIFLRLSPCEYVVRSSFAGISFLIFILRHTIKYFPCIHKKKPAVIKL